MDISYYRKAKNIERLSGTFKVRPYNIIEHQYMVAVLFRHFASLEDVQYDMNVFDIILNHDMLESCTQDLIYPIKNLSVHTKKAWQIIEEEALKVNPQLRRYSDESIRNGLTERQYLLFKACDILDLYIFLKEECAIGNSSKDILKAISTCERIMPDCFPKVTEFMNTYNY